MEEEKKNVQLGANGANTQNPDGQPTQNGNRHRRKKKKKSGNGQGQNAQNNQSQAQGKNVQNPQQNQKGQNQKQGKNQNGGNKNSQNQNAQKQNQGNQNTQKQSNQNNQNKKQKNQNKNQENQGGNSQKDNRKDTYVYVLDGNLYINLTNKCSNACDFCVRNERSSYYGHYLWLKNEVTVENVIAQTNALGDLSKFQEVVFCGFGEPTYKVTEMVALCDYFHEKGMKTRLNTNGQGNLINKRDIVPDLKDKLDLINVSLNASCVEKYQPICRSQYGESGFEAMIEFAKSCRKAGIPCRFSIVDCIGEDEVEACKRLAESVRVPLYIRSYITDSE